MIVASVQDPVWLTNTYLVAAEDGGDCLFVDAGAGPLAELFEIVQQRSLRPAAVLITHRHEDHVDQVLEICRAYPDVSVFAHGDELESIPVAVKNITGSEQLRFGELAVDLIHTPGHTSGSMSYHIAGNVFTGDTLYSGSVGAIRSPGHTTFADLRTSVAQLMALPPSTNVWPGHCGPTTVREELDANPFVRAWRDSTAPEGWCQVDGEQARLMVWAKDYDGGHKAWVRLADGRDDLVPGSLVVRFLAHQS